MKLCVIGNSHAAMIMAAHSEAPDGAEITFFGKPDLVPGEAELDGLILRARDPALVARLDTYGTDPALDLAQFDALVLVSMLPSVFPAVRMAQTHSVSGWPSTQNLLARSLMSASKPLSRPLLSDAAFRAALVGLCENGLAIPLARGIRAMSQIPIFVVPQPYPSAQVLEAAGKYPVIKRIVRDEDGDALVQDLQAAHATALSDIDQLVYLPQPDESVVSGCLTETSFTRGARRLTLSSEHAKDDVIHANARMGRSVLDRVKSSLQ